MCRKQIWGIFKFDALVYNKYVTFHVLHVADLFTKDQALFLIFAVLKRKNQVLLSIMAEEKCADSS